MMVLVLGAIAGLVRPDRRAAEAPAAVAIDNEGGCLVAGDPGQRQVWNKAGQLVRSTDRYGGETSFAYDTAGRRVMQTDAWRRVWRFEYGAKNRLAATTDPTGLRTDGEPGRRSREPHRDHRRPGGGSRTLHV